MTRFKVGQKVLAQIGQLEPWPAIIQSVVLNETQSGIYYHAKLLGSTQEIPVEAGNLKPLKHNKFKHKLTTAELKKGAKERETALFGPDDELPDFLWDLVAVESDYEELSDEEVSSLNLDGVKRTATEVREKYEAGPQEVQFDVRVPGSDDPLIRTLDNQLWTRQEYEECVALLLNLSKTPTEGDESIEPTKGDESIEPEIYELEEVEKNIIGRNGESSKPVSESQCSSMNESSIRFPCTTCPKRFKTRIALKQHVQNKRCENTATSELNRAHIRQLRKEKLRNIVHRNRSQKSLLKINGSQQITQTGRLVQEELDKKVEELLKSNTLRESPPKLHTCNLCCRKFRSRHALLDHKQSHNPYRSEESDLDVVDSDSLFAEEMKRRSKGNSDDDGSNDSRQQAHNSNERERRAELAAKFSELRNCLDISEPASKVRILAAGVDKIQELIEDEHNFLTQLSLLEDLNVRLRARIMQLRRV